MRKTVLQLHPAKGPMLVKQSVTRMFIQSIIGFIRRGMGLPSGKNFIKTALWRLPVNTSAILANMHREQKCRSR